MSDDRSLTIHQQSSLDVYGSGDDIVTFAKRIRLCLPGGERLNEAETLALSQLSVAYTLNPFNGEAWYIPGKGPMVGIKGLRKAARRQGQYWTEFVLLSPQERTDLNIPDEAIAYKCLVYRTDMIRQSAEAIKMMYDAGMKDAAERYAYKPTVGIGFCAKGEPTKMKPDQAARKRAEADALKVAFDLPFGTEVGNGNRVGYVDDLEAMDTTVDGETGEIVDVTPVRSPAPKQQPEPPAKPARPLSAAEVQRVVRKKAGWNGHRNDGEPLTPAQQTAVVAVMADVCKPTAGILASAETDNRRHAILEYLFGIQSTKALTKAEASAILDWLTVPGSTELNEWARSEAASVYAAWQEALGQQALPLGEATPL